MTTNNERIVIPFNFEVACRFKDYTHAMLLHYILFESVNKLKDFEELDGKTYIRMSKKVLEHRFPRKKFQTLKENLKGLYHEGYLHRKEFRNAEYFAIDTENPHVIEAYTNHKLWLKLTKTVYDNEVKDNYQQFLFPRLDYSEAFGMSQAIIVDRLMFLLAEGDKLGFEAIEHKNSLFLHLSKSKLHTSFPFFSAYNHIHRHMISGSEHVIMDDESLYSLNVNKIYTDNFYKNDPKFDKLMTKIRLIKLKNETTEKQLPVQIAPTFSPDSPNFSPDSPNFSAHAYNIINNLRERAFLKKYIKLNRRTSFLQAENSSSMKILFFEILEKNKQEKKTEKFLENFKKEKNTKNFKNAKKTFKENFTERKKVLTRRREFFCSGFDSGLGIMAWGNPLRPDFPVELKHLKFLYRSLDISDRSDSVLGIDPSPTQKALHKIWSLKVAAIKLLIKHKAILQLAFLNGFYEALELKRKNGEANQIKLVYVLQMMVNALQGDGGVTAGRYIWPFRWAEFHGLIDKHPELDFTAIRAYDVSDILRLLDSKLPTDYKGFVLSHRLEAVDPTIKDFTNVKINLDTIEHLLAETVS